MSKWVMDVIYSSGYFGIVFLMFIENVFPPIPSELIMPLAGFMVTKDQFSLAGIILAGTLGSVLGCLPLYYLGRKLGKDRLMRFADRHGRWLTVTGKDIERAQGWFDKYGAWAVVGCRLIPGIRSLISIPAGINKMSMVSFLLLSAVGSAIWTSVLALLGYALGSNFQKVEEYFDPIAYAVLGIIAALYLKRLLWDDRDEKDDEGEKSEASGA